MTSKLFHSVSSIQFRSFMDLLWFVLMEERWQDEDSALAITLVRALWTNKNDVCHGGLKKNRKQNFHWCTQYFDEYWAATAIQIKCNQPLESKWVPPIDLVYKVNVDGVVFSSQKQTRIGVIIRDSQGNFIASRSKKLNAPLGAIEAKAKAFEEGIVIVGEVGIQNFVIEGDCLAIVQALRDVSPTPSSVAPLVYGMIVATYRSQCVKFPMFDSKTIDLTIF